MPAYLKKVEDEVDEPETTIEELEEISLDEYDLEKKVLVSTLLSIKENDEVDDVPSREQRHICMVPLRHSRNRSIDG